MTGATPPLAAELPEEEAAGPIAAIYGDIRAAIGAPMVNLVYRRMATEPGCLAWAWGTVRPHFVSGGIGRAAAALVDELLPGGRHPIPRAALHAAGIDDAAERTIATVIEAYNRANPMNLIAMKVVALALDGGGPAPGAAPSHGDALPAALPSLPPLLDVDRLDPPTAGIVRLLARRATGGNDSVVPTAFRHLAHWPGFLALAAVATEPLFADDKIERAARAMEEAATEAAARLYRTAAASSPAPSPASSPGSSHVEPPSGEVGAALGALIASFPPMMCRMTAIGTWLHRSLPDRGLAGGSVDR